MRNFSHFVSVSSLLVASVVVQAYADSLPLTEKRGAIQLSVKRGRDGSVLLRVKAPKAENAKIFWFDKPDRLVADLPFKDGAPDWYRRIQLDNGGVAKGIRIGSHATKVRFVVDLTKPAKDVYKVSTRKDVVELLIDSRDAIKDFVEEAQASDEAVPAKPTPTPVYTPTPTATPTVVPTKEPTPTPSPTPTTVLEQPTVAPTMNAVELNPMDIEQPNSAAVKLTALGFEKGIKGERSLKLKFSKAVGYQLVRRSKELYVLIVENAEPASAELALPHFPPQDYEGFVSVRAQARDSQIQVFIYIEEGTHLLSVPYGSEIWLRTIDK